MSHQLAASGPFSKDEIQMEEFCLADFPENYRLWEHRRSANLDNPSAPSRTDRRDAYLYGHPLGRKKRFRSPADFFYHLEWLVFDPEADPENCRCKICSPDDVLKAGDDMRQVQIKLYGTAEEKAQFRSQTQDSKPGTPQNLSAAHTPVAAEPILPKPIPKATATQAVVDRVVARHDSASKTSSKASTPTAPLTQLAPKSTDPIPLVRPRHPEQALDQQVGSFIYRIGELVWFTRDNGAVGLAAVVARNRTEVAMGRQRPDYLLQPLSHPFKHPERAYIDDERRIVPWLAYSTPPCTHRALQETNQTFDTIRWEQFVNDPSGDTEVDGSIFAAKTIDMTFTLVQMLPLSDIPTMELDYNGVYLGGELIWVGEAVRIRGEAQRDQSRGIMIVSRIIERLHTGSKPSEVFPIGDTYELRTAQHNPARPHPPNRYLPQRVQEDLKYRNAARIAKRGEEMHWKFIDGQRRLTLTQIHGRWYESKSVLPVIQGEATVQQEAEAGDIPDVTPFLNTRGGSTLSEGQAGTKRQERLQAFSRSVPPDTVLQISFDERQLSAPRSSAPTITMTEAPAAGQGGNGSFGFVNMDQMDESGYPGAF